LKNVNTFTPIVCSFFPDECSSPKKIISLSKQCDKFDKKILYLIPKRPRILKLKSVNFKI